MLSRIIFAVTATYAAACSGDCCTCLKGGGGKGCSSKCSGCSNDCKVCVDNSGGGGCVTNGKCSCGSSPSPPSDERRRYPGQPRRRSPGPAPSDERRRYPGQPRRRSPGPSPSPSGGSCSADMSALRSWSKSQSQGKHPDGRCYSHVADYLDHTGYGGIKKNGFNDVIPPGYYDYAYQFASYLNKDGNAAKHCLKNVKSSYANNPYKAPGGAIVVVRAGTPGTAHPVAGDIAVAEGNGANFWNGGEMGYGGSGNFPSGNDYTLGIFIPTQCQPNCKALTMEDIMENVTSITV